MKYFSRKLVAILVLIIWLSSLGTNYAKADLSNAMTVSLGQNGYAKFNNGLLIQWGYVDYSSYNNTTYFPTSFLNNQYSVQITSMVPSDALVSIQVVEGSKTTTSFISRSRYIGTDLGDAGLQTGNDPYCWIAIGRWK